MCFSSLAVKCISAAKENDFPSQLPICLDDWLLGSVQAQCFSCGLMRTSLHESLSSCGLILPPRTLKRCFSLADSDHRCLVEQGRVPGPWIYKAWFLLAFLNLSQNIQCEEMYQRNSRVKLCSLKVPRTLGPHMVQGEAFAEKQRSELALEEFQWTKLEQSEGAH